MQRRIPLTPTPEHGDTKSVLRWAFPLPRVIADVSLWLERYEVLYVYEERKIEGNVEGKPMLFTVGGWVEVSQRRIRVPKTIVSNGK